MALLAPDTLAAYRACACWLASRHRPGAVTVLGLCGAQGSGKSTLADWLVGELASAHGLRTVVLSLDDCYLPRAQRMAMAERVHPLFATRGVPGSHDVALGCALLDALRAGRHLHPPLRLPRFSKADDDRIAVADWPLVEAPVDVVIFEGWCVGLPAQAEADLQTPVNRLEADEDRDGRWRRAINARLAGDYADWFARLDLRLFLAVPDFDAVTRWRGEQEAATRAAAGGRPTPLAEPAALARFIAHYERLSRHALAVMPQQADAVLWLDAAHRVARLRLGELPP